MKSKTLRCFRSLLLIPVVLAGGLLSSCRTTEGFGQDLQHLGSKIESEADQTGNY